MEEMLEDEIANIIGEQKQGEETAFKKSDGLISPIRTYKSDYSSMVKDKGIGKIDMVAAEMRRGYGSETNENSEFGPRKKINIFLPILVLLILGIAGYAGYLFFGSKTPSFIKQIAQIPPPLIFSEKQEKIVLKEATQNELSEEIRRATQKPFPRNNIVYLPIIKDSETAETNINLKKFLEIARFNLPANLSESLEDSYMMGLYSKNERYPILILKIKLYENAFAGIIAWESRISSDLANIWPIKKASTSDKFTDKTISNHDIRELKDAEGNLILTYSFLDRKTLAIATNEEALKAVFERFTFR